MACSCLVLCGIKIELMIATVLFAPMSPSHSLTNFSSQTTLSYMCVYILYSIRQKVMQHVIWPPGDEVSGRPGHVDVGGHLHTQPRRLEHHRVRVNLKYRWRNFEFVESITGQHQCHHHHRKIIRSFRPFDHDIIPPPPLKTIKVPKDLICFTYHFSNPTHIWMA